MRTLFIPLAKLLGIYEIFRVLLYTLFIISRAIRSQKFVDTVVTSCPIYAISLVLALILIFKAEKIADILKIPQDKTDSLVFDFHSILRVGLVLIGVAMLMHAIPSLIGLAIVMIPVQETGYPYYQLYHRLYTSILQVVFGSCLVLLANRLAQFLSKHKEQT